MNSPATSESAGRPLHILYADDVPQLRELMTEVLVRDGHSIETVPDGAVALERLTRSLAEFELLITDHHMPRMNGLELVQRLSVLPFHGKIVVFSSEISESVHDKYRELGVDLILPKPIFPLTLRRVLKELFVPGSDGINLHRSTSQPPLAPG